jgi:hypothetical protein
VPQDVVCGRETPRSAVSAFGRGSVRNPGNPLLSELARRVHTSEILTAVGVDDDRGAKRRRRVTVPQEELFAIALEGDFYQMIHERRFRVRPNAVGRLPAHLGGRRRPDAKRARLVARRRNVKCSRLIGR